MAFARTAMNLAIARTPVKQSLWTSIASVYQNNLTTRLNQYGASLCEGLQLLLLCLSVWVPDDLLWQLDTF